MRMTFEKASIETRRHWAEMMEAINKDKAAPKPQKDHNILTEVEKVINQHDPDKPGNVTDRGRGVASQEVVGKKYDILSEIEEVSEQHGRPEWIDADDWREMGNEVHSLYFKIEELSKQLPDRFHEAVRNEEWKLGLFIYRAHLDRPLPPLKQINLETHERDWDWNELSQYVAEAKRWIPEAEKLLSPEFF